MLTTKTVDLGNGCSIAIASLTFEQVEEMLVSPTPEDLKAQREQAWREVLMSVNNGRPESTRMSRADVQAVLEEHFPTLEAVNKFSELRLAVLEISGYEIKKKAELNPVPASQ